MRGFGVRYATLAAMAAVLVLTCWAPTAGACWINCQGTPPPPPPVYYCENGYWVPWLYPTYCPAYEPYYGAHLCPWWQPWCCWQTCCGWWETCCPDIRTSQGHGHCCPVNTTCCGVHGVCYNYGTERCCYDTGIGYKCRMDQGCCKGLCYDFQTQECCRDKGGTNDGYACPKGSTCCKGNCCEEGKCCCEGECGGVTDVTAGDKHKGETLYLANDYLDEPSKRAVVNVGVEATLNGSCPTCFKWSPDCPEDPDELPRICAEDALSATFSAKNHGSYGITASCSSCGQSMTIAIAGIDIKTSGIADADEMSKTYNIFLNENFNQALAETVPSGHQDCRKPDHSDNSVVGDAVDEIGTITVNRQTQGDNQAQIKFEVSTGNIKLYRTDTTRIIFGQYYAETDIPSSIKVEGISAGETTLTATIKTQDNATATDQLKIKVIRLNLVAVDPAPSSDEHEICHKDKMVVRVNNNDSDSDGLVDLNDNNVAGGDPDLAKITLQAPSGALAADISGNISITFPGNINAYTTQDKTGGAAPNSYALGSLPVDIYLEGASASGNVLASAVTVEMTLDSGIKCRDKLCLTVAKMDLKEVAFSGTKYRAIKKDDGSLDYTEPHWQDNSSPLDGDADDAGDRKYPVAYQSSGAGWDSYMNVSVRIDVAPAEAFSASQVKADNTSGYGFSDDGAVTGSYLQFNSGARQCDEKFDAERVQYLNPLVLAWKVSLDGGTKWFDVAESKNIIYVSWKEPTASPLYETPLMIGCNMAQNQTSQSAIVSAIWSEFTDRAVSRVDGMQMKYWSGGNSPQRIMGMLAHPNGDGSCIAWSQLLHWCMKSQGLGAVSQVWCIVADTSVNPGAAGFLVKNWTFGLHIRTGGDDVRDSTAAGDDQVWPPPYAVNAPCILPGPNGTLNSTPSGNDVSQDGLYSGTAYPYRIGYDVCDQTGVAGQANLDPPGAFRNHWVCKISGDIYDPSYGTPPCGSENAHEGASIDGIYDALGHCRRNDASQELLYFQDGDKE